MIALLLLLAQAVPEAPPASAGQSQWSILAPVANEPCVPKRKQPPDPGARGDDIVVCGHPLPSQVVPYAAEIPPDGPRPSNPDLTGRGALAVEATPCGAHQGGCPGGMDLFGAGTALVRLTQKVVAPNSCCEEPGEGTNPMLLVRDIAHGAKHVFAKKVDRSNRVPIAVDDAPPVGQILP